MFKYFESQKYCAVEIGEKMRFVKNQLRLNWCLISLKRNLLRGFVSYLYLLRSNISRKKLDFFLYRKNMCWFDRTVQQNLKNVLKRSDLKMFRKVLFLISKFFFPIWLAENKNEIQNHSSNVSSETFRRRNFWQSRWREV